MKKTLAILAFVFVTVFLNLKGAVSVEWENMYPLPEDQFYFWGDKTLDGGVMAFGYIGAHYISAVKFSPEGKIIWIKKYGFRGWINNVILLSDGNYIVSGTQENDELTWGYPLLMKINQNGDILWKKTYTELGIGVLNSTIRVPKDFEHGSGFFSVGYVYFNNRIENGKSVYILRTDSEGNIKWQKVFLQRRLKNLFYSRIVLTPSNEFVIGNTILLPESSEYSGYLLRVRDSSDVILDKLINLDFGVRNIFPEEDGFLLVGQSQTYTNLLFSRYDLSGRLVWEKEGSVNRAGHRNIYINDMLPLIDSLGKKTYLIVGGVEDKEIDIHGTSGDAFSFFAEITPEGEVLYYTISGDDNYWVAFADIISADESNTFFIIGAIRKKYEDWDSYLVKIKVSSNLPVPSRGLRGLIVQNQKKLKLVWNSSPNKVYIIWGTTNFTDWQFEDVVYSTNFTATWIGDITMPYKFFRVEERSQQ